MPKSNPRSNDSCSASEKETIKNLICFRFDDCGEIHWVSSPNEKEARRILKEDHDLDDQLDKATVAILDPMKKLRIRTEEIYPDGKNAPMTATFYVEDTIWNWCQHVGVGLIASTCY